MLFENTLDFAKSLDQQDPLADYRKEFLIPQRNGKDCIYFTGNSLGLQSKGVRKYINEELESWATMGVDGHFHSERRPWYHYHKYSKDVLAGIVGALPSEVVAMNNLTANLHFMMVSFYRPTSKRFKIIMESGAFPSDQYAVESQIKFHGYDYNETLVEVSPREGEHTLRTDDIVACIKEHGDEVALVLFSGIQYYTGQLFDLKAIAETGHDVGAFVGFDLAHAAGNVILNLHDINADFAVWCSYKYMNSGPGGVSGVFIHEKHHHDIDIPRFAGWWGQDETERFLMQKGFKPMPGADGWQVSNGNVLSTAAHLAALDLFIPTSLNKSSA
ncbi:MAG: kynureninase, partial [Bacteroidota bacterium]